MGIVEEVFLILWSAGHPASVDGHIVASLDNADDHSVRTFVIRVGHEQTWARS